MSDTCVAPSTTREYQVGHGSQKLCFTMTDISTGIKLKTQQMTTIITKRAQLSTGVKEQRSIRQYTEEIYENSIHEKRHRDEKKCKRPETKEHKDE
jgi:hypothetical protein